MENQNPTISPILPTQPQNIPAGQSQPIQPPIKTHNWLKLLIIAVIIILVLTIVGVGSFLLGTNKNNTKPVVQITPALTVTPTPTLDPTANWKTYANNVFGYSIKYPDSWAVSENINGPILRIDDSKNQGAGVYFTIIDDPENISIENKIHSPVETIKLTYSDVTINGIAAKRANLPNQQGCTPGDDSVFIKKGTVIYEIQNRCGFVAAAIFNQILSTFKFTDQQLPPGGQYSSEGQSCGTNAGPAGNAQCAPGLTCKYTTPQEQTSGIGTCVKE